MKKNKSNFGFIFTGVLLMVVVAMGIQLLMLLGFFAGFPIIEIRDCLSNVTFC